METPLLDAFHCPAGLIAEMDLIRRFPERREEILQHALRQRERQRLETRELRRRLTWHPVHTGKLIAISGSLAFVLTWLISSLGAIGHWYVRATQWSVHVPVPFAANTQLNLGSHLPTSTTLTVIGSFPEFGLKEVMFVASFVSLVVFLEQIASTLLHWRDGRRLEINEREITEEIRLLHQLLAV